LYLLLEDPFSSTTAFVLALTTMCVIFACTVTFCVETIPAYSESDEYGNPGVTSTWFLSESGFITYFTLELLLRVWVFEDFPIFVKTRLNLVDVLTIVPYYLELIGASGGVNLRFIRVCRLARIFRVFKFSRRYSCAAVLAGVLKDSVAPLAIPFFFMLLAIIIISSLMFFIEQGEYDASQKKFFVTNNIRQRTESLFVLIPDNFTLRHSILSSIAFISISTSVVYL